MATKLPVSSLAPRWFEVLETILHQVLATKTAEVAFAQVIDGLPTASTAVKYGVDDTRSDIIDRAEPCAGSLYTFQQFRESFQQALQNYQNAPLHSIRFKLQLLALVAMAVHDLAIKIFTAFHPEGGPNHPNKIRWPEGIYMPDLRHPNYMCWHQYPRGPAELVGYWAEAEIFGGAVVFEHGLNDELQNVFIHPPFLPLFKLSITQIDEFANIPTSSSPSLLPAGNTPYHRSSEARKTLPFYPEPHAQKIIDDIGIYPLIYRDKYERVPKIRLPEGESGCVRRGIVTEEMRDFVKGLPH